MSDALEAQKLLLKIVVVLLPALLVYWSLPQRWRSGVLALASMLCLGMCYWWGNVLVLLGLALAVFYLAPLAGRRGRGGSAAGAMTRAQATTRPSGAGRSGPRDDARPEAAGSPRHWILWMTFAVLLAYLVACKYIAPRQHALLSPWLAPIGISYFTFKFIHYMIEVARGNIRDRSITQFLDYIFLFPIFTAGPIERFDHFLSQQDRRWSSAHLVEGSYRIIGGLIKKFFFAELLLHERAMPVLNGAMILNLGSQRTMELWYAGIAAYLYYYADFAGYCDLAIGASRLFGLKIMENFDWPLLAPNIAVFWKRWHMTLAGWCQSYIYMPLLGLTRRSNLAVYATFVVMGLWHMASAPWIMWGIFHATGVVAYAHIARWRRKHHWTWGMTPLKNPWAEGLRLAPGIALTILFVSAGELLSFGLMSAGVDHHRHHYEALRSAYDVLRLAAKMLFIDLPNGSHQ